MKNNTLAEDYGIFKACAAEYDAAENEEAKEAARKKVQELYAQVDARGEDYVRLYKLYESAQERENEYIDLNDCIWDKDVQGLIDSFRKYGIDHFTFSSTWSSAVETAWLFLQNGCTLEGLIEINSQYKVFASDEHEKAHGYLFKVN